ncbi:MAG TPA: isoprenylcysteine carboxylmethyltransferase family protein [Myxococcaceae bacterium]|nr:isoprenylcysteine carboxylmethyltransferase family protein [Myxococcaceae bacterium]
MGRRARWVLGVAGAAWAALAFGMAGEPEWREGWLYFGMVTLGLTAVRLYATRRNPELVAARRWIGADTPTWDKLWVLVYWPLLLSVPVAAGRAHRAGADPLPGWVLAVGALLAAGGFAIAAAAQAQNPFFEVTARLQTERAQRVVEAGPYRRVRHPGYLGLALWGTGAALLLRSTVALALSGVLAGWIVLRTALEDRMLRRSLAGYDAYAQRVRARLIPGLW